MAHTGLASAGPFDRHAEDAIPIVQWPNFALAWSIYTVHPAYWQTAAYYYFVLGKPSGEQFNQRDVTCWVMLRFGKEELL